MVFSMDRNGTPGRQSLWVVVMDVIRLMERRDKYLERANKHFVQMQKLEEKAIHLDIKISEICTHPEEYRKLIQFTKGIPQSSIWLCKICYEQIETKIEIKKKDKIKSSIENTFNSFELNWEDK